MSTIKFAFRHVNDSNQDLLCAIADQFDILYSEREEEKPLTTWDVLDEVYHTITNNNRIITIDVDDYYEFERITNVLVAQQIPYDIYHHSDYDSNAAVEVHRPGLNNIIKSNHSNQYYKDVRFLSSSDSRNEPMLSLTEIREIIDSSDESETDISILDRLAVYMNAIDYGREGNRIEDFV